MCCSPLVMLFLLCQDSSLLRVCCSYHPSTSAIRGAHLGSAFCLLPAAGSGWHQGLALFATAVFAVHLRGSMGGAAMWLLVHVDAFGLLAMMMPAQGW